MMKDKGENIMTNKSLIVKKKDSIFDKIISFFKSIFHKKVDSKEVEPKEVENINEKDNIENVAKEENTNEIEKMNKEKFFKLYEDVKNEKINVEDLSISEIIVINAMLKEEIDMKLKKLQEKVQF